MLCYYIRPSSRKHDNIKPNETITTEVYLWKSFGFS